MRRIYTVVAAALSGLLISASLAFASPQTEAVTSAASALKDDMISVGTTVLPYAAAVLIISIGWRFAKRFVRG